jgi:hypothetical protein
LLQRSCEQEKLIFLFLNNFYYFLFYSTRSESMQFRQAACEAYLKTRDASSVAKLIKSMLRQSEPGAENEARDQAAGLAGPLIIEIFDRAPKYSFSFFHFI